MNLSMQYSAMLWWTSIVTQYWSMISRAVAASSFLPVTALVTVSENPVHLSSRPCISPFTLGIRALRPPGVTDGTMARSVMKEIRSPQVDIVAMRV